jgi:hypothetical protein
VRWQVLKVVLKHEGSWLLIKEVYMVKRGVRRRRSRSKQQASPYSTVAESISAPPIDGYKFASEIEVPATKVMRFIIKMFQAPGEAVIVIEPSSLETYKALIYAKTRREAERVSKLAESVISQLRTRRGKEAEEIVASEVYEVEEAEEEEE